MLRLKSHSIWYILLLVAVSLLVFPVGSCKKKKPPAEVPAARPVERKPAPVKPRMESLIPKDALFLIEIPKVETLRTNFEQSALYAIYKEEPFQEMVSAFKGLEREEGEGIEEKLGITREDFRDAFKGEVALAILDVKRKSGEPEGEKEPEVLPSSGEEGSSAQKAVSKPKIEVELLFIAEVSEGGKKVEEIISRVKEKKGFEEKKVTVRDVDVRRFEGPGGKGFSCAYIKGFFVLGLPAEGVIEKAIDLSKEGAEGTLGGDDLFRETRANSFSPEDNYFVFVNAGRLFERYGGSLPEEVRKVLEAVGITGVEALGASGAFVGPAVRETFFIKVPESRQGVFRAVSSEKVPADALAKVPSNVVDVAVAQMDFPALWQSARGVLEALGPAGEKARSEIDKFQAEAGVNIDDLLKGLGTLVTTYSFLPEKGEGPSILIGGAKPEQVSFISLKDRANFEANLGKLHDYLRSKNAAPEGTAGETAPAKAKIVLKEIEYEDHTIYSLSGAGQAGKMPVPVGLCYTIDGDDLIVASDVDHIRAAIDRSGQTYESIENEGAFRDIVEHLPAERNFFRYSDLKAAFGFYYDLFKPIVQMQAAAIPESPLREVLQKLPPKETFTKHLFSIGLVMNVTEGGIRLQSYGAVGANQMMAIGAGFAVAVARTAELKKAAAAKREAPPRPPRELTETEKALEGIGVALHIYSREHNGEFPARLEDLVPRYLDDAVALQSPVKPREEGIGFGYVSGLRYDLSDERIVVYDLKGNQPEGRYVLLVNGKTEFLTEEEFQDKMHGQGSKSVR